MAIEKANILIAAGTFSSANPIVTNFQNGCKVARGGAGTYTVTLDTDVGAAPSTNAIMLCQAVVAQGTAAVVTCVQTSSTVFTITSSATLGGAAADIAGLQIHFVVLAIGAPGTSGV